MRPDDCDTGISAKVLINSSDDNKFSVKMGDKILSKLIPNVHTLGEQLLYLEPVNLTYNKDTSVVTKIN